LSLYYATLSACDSTTSRQATLDQFAYAPGAVSLDAFHAVTIILSKDFWGIFLGLVD
jgi:hypothetical protein